GLETPSDVVGAGRSRSLRPQGTRSRTFINLPPWLWRRDERGRSRLPSPSRLRVSTLRTPLVGRPAGKAGDRNLVWRRSPSRPWRLRCVDPPPFRLQTAPMLQNLETLAREARSW